MRGSFLVRDLDSGQELGIEADVEWPVASLVKVPIAVATLDHEATTVSPPADASSLDATSGSAFRPNAR